MKTRIAIIILLSALIVMAIFFLIITATTSKPTFIELQIPEENKSKDDNHTVSACTQTLLLHSNSSVYYYMGNNITDIKRTSLDTSGLNSILSEQKRSCDTNLVVTIKPTEKASYKNTVDALDLMTINHIKKILIN